MEPLKGRRRKRGQNEGSVHQRPDGRWEAKVRLGFRPDGKPVRPSFYASTRAAAVKKMDDAIRRFRGGVPIVVDNQRVGEFLSSWLDTVAKPRLKPRTFADYSLVVEKHLAPALGRHKLRELAPQHVQAFIASKTETLSPRRVVILRAVLRTALNHAMRCEYVSRNVATLVTLPRAARYRANVLDQAAARKFVKAARKHRIGALFTVALAAGLRLGEALGLSWDDVDLRRGTLHVRRTLQRVDGELVFGEPKSERSVRTVQLPGVAVQVLKRHRRNQNRERKEGSTWRESGLVFTSTVGTPLDDRNVRRAFKEVLAAAHLQNMRIHDLRHTCATLLLAEGVNPRVVMETLGHSQVTLTLNTYSHVLPSVQKEAAERMDEVLG